MTPRLDTLRAGSAEVARRAHYVRINQSAIPVYVSELLGQAPEAADAETHLGHGSPEERAAFWLTLDAINFGSGWFPTLRKTQGRSGYHTIATGLRQRFERHGSWSPAQLEAIQAEEIATALGQDPAHELMELFARSLRDLGARVTRDHRGRFTSVVEQARGSASALVEELAGWSCFADSATYDELTLPFLKRAQIAAADLDRAGVAGFEDLDRLTMFADNLVPHVLRVDGVLTYEPGLLVRIDRGELVLPGSPEEVELRACAVHAVELMAASRPGTYPAQLDQILWLRGQGERYKSQPRHRTRCTAY